MAKLSLTNSKDIVCNSLKIIHGNDIIDILELFLLRTSVADIIGMAPSTLDTLAEIARAIGNDPDFITTINNKINLKANISDVYSKSYIDVLNASLFTKEQTLDLLSLKLDVNIINSYYNKTYIDAGFSLYYTQQQVDNFVNAKLNIGDVYNNVSIDTMMDFKLNILDYISGNSLKADANSVYIKSLTYSKLELDVLLNNKIATDTSYTIAQTNTLLNSKLDTSVYNTGIALKANIADYYVKSLLYTKTQMDTSMALKLNSSVISSYNTKTEITTAFNNYYNKLYIDNSFYLKADIDTTIAGLTTSLNLKALLSDIVIVNDKINLKADKLNTYTKAEIDNIMLLNTDGELITLSEITNILLNKVDIVDYQTAINLKSNISDVYYRSDLYTKSEINSSLSLKLDTSIITSYNTKAEIDTYFTNYYNKINIDTLIYKKDVVNTLFNSLVDDIEAVNIKVDLKSDISTTYNKTQIGAMLLLKADLTAFFSKEEITEYLLDKLNITDFQTANNLKAAISDVYYKTELYNKTEITNFLSLKFDASLIASYYNKSEINTAFNNYYSKTYIDNTYYIKTAIDSLLTTITNNINLKSDISSLSLKQNTITGLLADVLINTVTINRVLISSNVGRLVTSSILSSELDYLSGLTSNIQTQLGLKTNQTDFITLQTQYNTLNTTSNTNKNNITLLTTTVNDGMLARYLKTEVDARIVILNDSIALKADMSTYNSGTSLKQNLITGTLSDILNSTLTAYRVMITTLNGKATVSGVTTTELNYLIGVTSSIQTQLNVLNTSMNTNTTNITSLTSSVNSGMIARYLKTEVDALIAILNNSINTKINIVDNTALLNLKQDKITGMMLNFINDIGTASRVVVSDSTNKLITSDITVTQLESLSGITSNIQNQITLLSISTNTNGLNISTLNLNVAEGFLLRYLKTEVDALLSTIHTNINLKMNITDVNTSLNLKQNLITGMLSEVLISNAAGSRVVVTTSAGKLSYSSITNSELGFLAGVSSNVQTQISAVVASNTSDIADLAAYKILVSNDFLNRYIKSEIDLLLLSITDNLNLKLNTTDYATGIGLKQNIITGFLASVLVNTVTINRVLISSSAGTLVTSPVLSTELAYLTGATSSIQTQLNSLNTLKTNQTDFTSLNTLVSTGFLARYLKTEVDALVVTINTNINLKLNTVDYITGINLKSNVADVYTKTQSDTALSLKVDITDYNIGLSTKQNIITGFLSDVLNSTATSNRVIISSSTGKIVTSNITNTELNYLDNTTSNIQDQLNLKAFLVDVYLKTDLYTKTEITAALNLKAPLLNPYFTGTLRISGADLRLYTSVRSPNKVHDGRALVHAPDNILSINYAGDYDSVIVDSDLAITGNLSAPNIYSKTEVDNLLTPLINSSRVVETSILTTLKGGTNGVQLTTSDNTLLMAIAPAGIAVMKELVCSNGISCYGPAVFDENITTSGAILTDTLNSKTTDGTITINNNVLINGTIKSNKYFAEFYTAANSVNYTTVITVPFDTTRINNYNAFTLLNNEITVNVAMNISITFKVAADTVLGTYNSVVKSYLEVAFAGGTFYSLIEGSNIFSYHKALNFGCGSSSSTHLLQVFVGSKIRIRTLRNTGNDTMKTLAGGCNISIIEI